MQPIQVHQNDAGIALRFHCQDQTGRPIDLTGYTAHFELYDGSSLINGGQTQCALPDPALGQVEYQLTGNDTANPGLLMGLLRLENGLDSIRNVSDLVIEVRS